MTKLLRTLLPVTLAMGLMLTLAGCMEPDPGEVGLSVTLNGQVVSCNVLVFNDKGKQIQMESADQYGVAYIKKLPPGTYTLKFSGADNTMYPAVRTVKVEAGGSDNIKVELSQADASAAGAAPGSS